MFEWDEAKNKSNLEKHGISFDDVVEVFDDPFAITREDTDHDEQRFFTVGQAKYLVVVAVAYSYEEAALRIISARRATKTERKYYEQKKR